MQAKGLACLQSIVYESPPDIKRCRLQQWPEEVSRFQQFCMELHKPIETGFAMLACMMKYSPRAWHQSSKHRRGLTSIAEEHKNSFFKYTSSISSEAELWAWQLAFNYHARKRNLGLALECTCTRRTSLPEEETDGTETKASHGVLRRRTGRAVQPLPEHLHQTAHL